MDNEFVPLKVVRITYNQIESGMYALVLEEIGGNRRFPIIVGYTEAQSIECIMQNISTPRPLTHAFVSKILDSFDIRIRHVLIKQQPNGIYTSDVTFYQQDNVQVLDARASDAIALALRSGAPIFISQDLLHKVGIDRDSLSPRRNPQSIPVRQAIARVSRTAESPYENVTDEKLQKMMEKAVAEEDYEKADSIKSEIMRRNGDKDSMR